MIQPPDVLPNGDLIVPARAHDQATGLLGDGVKVAKVGSGEHADWVSWMKAQNVKPRPVPESQRPGSTSKSASGISPMSGE